MNGMTKRKTKFVSITNISKTGFAYVPWLRTLIALTAHNDDDDDSMIMFNP
jgi:hypothetical protein